MFTRNANRIPLDFISSKSVKYSHSYGFSSASAEEIAPALFDHTMVTLIKNTKEELCSLGSSLPQSAAGNTLEPMYYHQRVVQVDCFALGALLFLGSFDFYCWDRLIFPDDLLSEFSADRNDLAFKKETL